MEFYLSIQHQIKTIPAFSMLEHAATKEEASDRAHGEGANEKNVAQGDKTFEKNSQRNINSDRKYEGTPRGWVLLFLEMILTCS